MDPFYIQRIDGLRFVRMGSRYRWNISLLLDMARARELVMVSHRSVKSVDAATGMPNQGILDVMKTLSAGTDRAFWVDFMFFPRDMPLRERRRLYPELWILYAISDRMLFFDHEDVTRLWINAELSMMCDDAHMIGDDRTGEILYSAVDPRAWKTLTPRLSDCITDMMSPKLISFARSNMDNLKSTGAWRIMEMFLTKTAAKLSTFTSTDPDDLLWVTLSYFCVKLFMISNRTLEDGWIEDMVRLFDMIMTTEYDGLNGRVGWFFNWKTQTRVPWNWVQLVWDTCVMWDQDAANPRTFGQSGIKTFDHQWASMIRDRLLKELYEGTVETVQVDI